MMLTALGEVSLVSESLTAGHWLEPRGEGLDVAYLIQRRDFVHAASEGDAPEMDGSTDLDQARQGTIAESDESLPEGALRPQAEAKHTQ
jgi:hypothetical protein